MKIYSFFNGKINIFPRGMGKFFDTFPDVIWTPFELNILAVSIYSNYFIFHISMADFKQEIKRLQKLSCIALSVEQEDKLWKQLEGIIALLGQLPETNVSISKPKDSRSKLSLRTIAGVKEDVNSKKLMTNVKHTIVNNSILIKSVLH